MALVRYQIPERVFGAFQTDGTVAMVKAADVEAVLKDLWDGHQLCEDHGELGYWKNNQWQSLGALRGGG